MKTRGTTRQDHHQTRDSRDTTAGHGTGTTAASSAMAPPAHDVSWVNDARATAGDSAVQLQGDGPLPAGQVQRAAKQGIADAGAPLPHLDVIQRAFGRHDVTGVRAHVGDAATAASEAIGAEGFTKGDHVAFRKTPDLHTAAHEAAHVVQQRFGVQVADGVGQPGDRYEQNADAVADRVVAGGSAEDLLDPMQGAAGGSPGIQRKPATRAPVQGAWGSWGKKPSGSSSGAASGSGGAARSGGGWGAWGMGGGAGGGWGKTGAGAGNTAGAGAHDQTIARSNDLAAVESAFESYWNITLESKGGGRWDVATLRGIHGQLKRLPRQHVQGGLLKRLSVGEGAGGYWDKGRGEVHIGQDVRDIDYATYGRGTTVARAAKAGATAVDVVDGGMFAVGERVRVGASAVYTIAAKDEVTLTLDRELGQDVAKDAVVASAGDAGKHDIDWADATIRHEVGHLMDTAIGGAEGFYDLGGWSNHDIDSNGFARWVSAMGAGAWRAEDGAELTRDERDEVKSAIVDAAVDGLSDPREGLGADHAIVTYWDRGVPVIAAARASLAQGNEFWASPQDIPRIHGKRFTINPTYDEFQSCDDQVYTHRVSDYATFSPAEFFAEAYTVYYEDTGKPGGKKPGQRMPVAKWRTWITSNVAGERGGAGASAGKSAVQWGKATVGVTAGKSGSKS